MVIIFCVTEIALPEISLFFLCFEWLVIHLPGSSYRFWNPLGGVDGAFRNSGCSCLGLATLFTIS